MKNSKIVLVLLFGTLLVLLGCSNEDVQNIGSKVGEYYNNSQRDNVAQNWTKNIQDTPECEVYKTRLIEESLKHNSAASGAFVNGMRSVLDTAIQANCSTVK